MHTSPSIKRVLQKARALLAKKGGWTQQCNARGKSGRPLGYVSRAATCFCLDGALRRVTHGPLSKYRYWEVELAVLAVIPREEDIVVWNDKPRRTQKQVVALLDRAIKAEGP